SDWTEGTGNGSATADGATYNTKDGVSAWAGGSNGGALDGTDIGLLPIGSFFPKTTMAADTELIASLAVGGITLGGTLHLVVVRNGTSTATITSYRSKQSATTTSRPKLTIVSAPPVTRTAPTSAAVQATLLRTATASAAVMS